MQARGALVGRDLAVGRVEVDPRRHPHHRPHPVLPHARDQPRRVRELVGVELPGVVLRLPRRVDDDRVERERVLAVALEVVLDVALVLVDVAALPVPVGPLGQQRRERAAPRAGTRAAARRASERRTGAAAAARPPRARRSRSRRRARTARPAPRSQPRRPAARGEHPRHRRVVALRDAALVEHVGRAVRARVAAVGAERDGAPAPGRRAGRGARRARSAAARDGPARRGRAAARAARRRARRRRARARGQVELGQHHVEHASVPRPARPRAARPASARDGASGRRASRRRSRPRSTARSGRGSRRRGRAARSDRRAAVPSRRTMTCNGAAATSTLSRPCSRSTASAPTFCDPRAGSPCRFTGRSRLDSPDGHESAGNRRDP